jgi:hypothetical protein
MLNPTLYSIDTIRDEVRHLTDCKAIDRHQPIYTLCRYFPSREWVCIECELEQNDFLMRDPIGDLLGQETWSND